jgi:hypothetical protein
MRAYKGKIEATSPLAAQAAAEAAKAKPAPAEEKKKPAPAAPASKPEAYVQAPAGNNTASNLIAVGAIVVLAIAAVALVIALAVK